MSFELPDPARDEDAATNIRRGPSSSRDEIAAQGRESAIQCAAYVGGEQGRCPKMGWRENDKMIDADGTGRMVWVSWCDSHKPPSKPPLNYAEQRQFLRRLDAGEGQVAE